MSSSCGAAIVSPFEAYWRDASDGLGDAPQAEVNMMRAWAMDAFNAGARSSAPSEKERIGGEAEPESKPVAYALRSKDDGSLFDSIVPVGYATFDARMERFRKEPWVVNGRAEIVPLYDSSQYVDAGAALLSHDCRSHMACKVCGCLALPYISPQEGKK